MLGALLRLAPARNAGRTATWLLKRPHSASATIKREAKTFWNMLFQDPLIGVTLLIGSGIITSSFYSVSNREIANPFCYLDFHIWNFIASW